MTTANSKNVERFSGFAGTYDQFRPEAPEMVCSLLSAYLDRKADCVVDLGSGTGLSTLIWQSTALEVIGVEPNEDMRKYAERKIMEGGYPNVSFVKGFSHDTGLLDQSADIVTCSQSFHWMEPVSTLMEVHRLLKPGGIFAAYDCDWPPTVDWVCEKAYQELLDYTQKLLEERLPQNERVSKWDKDRHLDNIRMSGFFRFAKEMVFHQTGVCKAEDFFGIALSQGGLQSGLKHFPDEMAPKLEAFLDTVKERFRGTSRTLLFSYRMRIGIK